MHPGSPDTLLAAMAPWLAEVQRSAAKLGALQAEYFDKQTKLWSALLSGSPAALADADPGDRRFAAKEWRDNAYYGYLKQSYLLAARYLEQLVEGAELDAQARERTRFAVRQWIDAMCPANFAATNPTAMREALETRGESLTRGLANLMGAVQKGRISMTDESAFEVGRNIAVTQGAVVWQDPLIQLIQYAPTTARVHERPLVMVPPCINKYYLMDLQPENSLVRYGLEQGHTVFMVSWRNVKERQAKVTWDEYIASLIAALEETKRITKSPKINALGFCIGGTLLGAALAVLEKRGRNPAVSLTLLTALLEFSEVGEIRVYIDENFVGKREKQLEKGGIVPGGELAGAFSSLRANDLVWSYVVNNYLKGKQPPAFDLLYWNSDATNLPGPMYAYYLRNTYQDNKLCQPDALTMLGTPVSLKRLKLPAFVFAAREDHIVPWKGAYASARCLGGPVTFVLGASGHIAGTINPASKNKRSYWMNAKRPADAEKWFVEAKELPGSWWPEWSRWLRAHAGNLVPARKTLGDGKKKPIEPAPGRYAKERI